jgi:hypothetical protein
MKQRGWREINTWTLTVCTVAVFIGVSAGTLSAQGRIATLEQRFDGAERVVVAEARTVAGGWRQNAYGDRIIVTRVLLTVDETFKGAAAEQLWLEVEGGTVDGITLEVSSVPLMHAGDRAVFFLDPAEGNMHRPFQKGQGILKLDKDELVRGSTLHLNQIRSLSLGKR